MNTNLGRFKPGKDHRLWKGGRVKDSNGYILICMPRMKNGYIYEHRLVMEQKLGRKLSSTETVHHCNGVRDDNRVENLELRITQHGKGHAYENMSTGQIAELINHLTSILASRIP